MIDAECPACIYLQQCTFLQQQQSCSMPLFCMHAPQCCCTYTVHKDALLLSLMNDRANKIHPTSNPLAPLSFCAVSWLIWRLFTYFFYISYIYGTSIGREAKTITASKLEIELLCPEKPLCWPPGNRFAKIEQLFIIFLASKKKLHLLPACLSWQLLRLLTYHSSLFY